MEYRQLQSHCVTPPSTPTRTVYGGQHPQADRLSVPLELHWQEGCSQNKQKIWGIRHPYDVLWLDIESNWDDQ